MIVLPNATKGEDEGEKSRASRSAEPRNIAAATNPAAAERMHLGRSGGLVSEELIPSVRSPGHIGCSSTAQPR